MATACDSIRLSWDAKPGGAVNKAYDSLTGRWVDTCDFLKGKLHVLSSRNLIFRASEYADCRYVGPGGF